MESKNEIQFTTDNFSEQLEKLKKKFYVYTISGIVSS